MVRGFKLAQKYWVDIYAKVERARMMYIEHNQRHLKADLYKGLLDAKDRNHLLADQSSYLPP